MANIKVNNLSVLNLSGAELFDDAESFMMELNDEQTGIMGGQAQCGTTVIVSCTVGAPTCQVTQGNCTANTQIVFTRQR
jgi:hypothetical protein